MVRDNDDEIAKKSQSVLTRLPSIEQLKSAINALKPTNKRSAIDSLITGCHAEIQSAIDDGVTKKAILAELALQGLKMSPLKLNSLLGAEVKRRSTQSTTGGAK